jgi:hypothetical protein
MTEEIRFLDPDEMMKANQDYISRMEREGLDAVYDATLDTLFIEIGGPKEALSEHLADNIMIRVDPDTLRIEGLEILDFFEDFLPNNRLAQSLVQDLELRQGQDSRLALMEPRFKHIREVIAALVPSYTPSTST